MRLRMIPWLCPVLAVLLCSCRLSSSHSWSSENVVAATPMTLHSFEFTDRGAFRIADDGGRPCLELFREADYAPPHRSPKGMAIVIGGGVDDFVLEVEAKQTGREYPHRDLVFVFGWRDAAHFCYAHLASGADASAHHIQLVDGADRRPVTTWRTSGVAWGDGWHRIRVERRGHSVTVGFDGEPVLRGEVPAWRGSVGLGSFDDTGRFRELRVTQG
jgi:hypothetical protein